MVETTTYSPFDLTDGICSSCGADSHEIYIHDEEGRCVDCIHCDDFYEMTMEGL